MKQREALALRKKETPTEYPKDFDYDQYPDNDEGGPVEHSGEAYNGICLGMVFSKNYGNLKKIIKK